MIDEYLEHFLTEAGRAMNEGDWDAYGNLFSDGNQITGDVLAAAKATGVPISVVPLPGEERRENFPPNMAARSFMDNRPRPCLVLSNSLDTNPMPSSSAKKMIWGYPFIIESLKCFARECFSEFVSASCESR